MIDLSQPLFDGMAVYPGDPPVAVRPAATLARDGYRVHRLCLNTQAGTHVETQQHFLPGRWLDDEPLDRFVGRAAIVPAPCGPIAIADLAPFADRIARCPFVVLHTDYGPGRIDPDATDRPVLEPTAAHWLGDRGVQLFGIDAFDFDRGPDYPAHRILLERGILIVEGLVNLGALPADVVQMFVLPLPLRGVEGSPCRAFAIVEPEHSAGR